jgi:hypothetical protein
VRESAGWPAGLGPDEGGDPVVQLVGPVAVGTGPYGVAATTVPRHRR